MATKPPAMLDDMQEVLDAALSNLHSFQKEMGAKPELLPGQKRPTDDELLQMINSQIQAYPPEMMIDPTGQQKMVSPYVAALSLDKMANGDETLQRVIKILKQKGEL